MGSVELLQIFGVICGALAWLLPRRGIFGRWHLLSLVVLVVGVPADASGQWGSGLRFERRTWVPNSRSVSGLAVEHTVEFQIQSNEVFALTDFKGYWVANVLGTYEASHQSLDASGQYVQTDYVQGYANASVTVSKSPDPAYSYIADVQMSGPYGFSSRLYGRFGSIAGPNGGFKVAVELHEVERWLLQDWSFLNQFKDPPDDPPLPIVINPEYAADAGAGPHPVAGTYYNGALILYDVGLPPVTASTQPTTQATTQATASTQPTESVDDQMAKTFGDLVDKAVGEVEHAQNAFDDQQFLKWLKLATFEKPSDQQFVSAVYTFGQTGWGNNAPPTPNGADPQIFNGHMLEATVSLVSGVGHSPTTQPIVLDIYQMIYNAVDVLGPYKDTYGLDIFKAFVGLLAITKTAGWAWRMLLWTLAPSTLSSPKLEVHVGEPLTVMPGVSRPAAVPPPFPRPRRRIGSRVVDKMLGNDGSWEY